MTGFILKGNDKMDTRINVTKTTLPDFDDYIEEIRDIWDTHWVTNMGPKHNKLCDMLKEKLEVDNIELIVNGHMSLELAIQSLDLKGEVITTPFTFASTTHAIVRNGLKPVFCDIKHSDYTIDEDQIESLITDKTSAILPVHVYGNICNDEKIQKIADKYNLKVIYDAAHAFGEKKCGKCIAAYGDASCFSFHATKVFNTIEGGAISYRNPAMGKKIYQLKNFGIEGPENVEGVGANAKMNEFCAAMGICNLKRLDKDIESRKKVVERYIECLSEFKSLRVNKYSDDIEANYAYMPVEFENEAVRNHVFAALSEENIYTRKYFYPIVSEFGCYKNMYDSNKTPVAKSVSEKILCLPLYAGLDFKVIDEIYAKLKQIL